MIWYVAAGGALGSISRYALGTLLPFRAGIDFPWITFIINIGGSAFLGLLMRLSGPTFDLSPEIRLMLTTGFCGGFTTFSAFSFENMMLIQNGHYGKAFLYVASSVILSLLGVLIGINVARYWVS